MLGSFFTLRNFQQSARAEGRAKIAKNFNDYWCGSKYNFDPIFIYDWGLDMASKALPSQQ
jgi:hypothetical protein